MGDAEVKADGLPGRAVGKRNSSDEEKEKLQKRLQRDIYF